MEEKIDFETIRNGWRRLSGELEPAILSMSGDSTESIQTKKDEPERKSLVPEKITESTVAAASIATDASDIESDNADEEIVNKQEHDITDNNEKEKSQGDGLLSKGKVKNNYKVDSAKSQPSEKTQSSDSENGQQDDCGIKCLYYTMQCFECTIL